LRPEAAIARQYADFQSLTRFGLSLGSSMCRAFKARLIGIHKIALGAAHFIISL
jgi:hypothetical protein